MNQVSYNLNKRHNSILHLVKSIALLSKFLNKIQLQSPHKMKVKKHKNKKTMT